MSTRFLQTTILAAVVLLALAQTGSSADFYLDSDGNDGNNGHSPKKAWRSLARVNETELKPGDHVYFRAGSTWREQLRITCSGTASQPIVFRSTGHEPLPRIDGGGLFEDVVLVSNAQHIAVSGLELTNDDGRRGVTNSLPRRGVHIVADNAGTLTNIVISELYIHDIRGTQSRKDNGGIIFTTRGQRVPTCFQNLRIERNIIWRADRSGIVASSYHASRARWFPSYGVVIRDNWLGDLGGDGITPWATDGCVVEHNILEGANERAGTYNAGIWPWSTDNTLMRLNRASGVKTLMDGQGFDSDYNSHNTVIEYNLSHDNEGGFLLVCTPGKRNSQENCGNIGTVARYNISRHDGARTFHFAGEPENTSIYGNAIYIGPHQQRVQALLFSNWSGWAKGVEMCNNLFHSLGLAEYGHETSRTGGVYTLGPGWGLATNLWLAGNAYPGHHQYKPTELDIPGSSAPTPMSFPDWPGPQFDPRHPEKFSDYIQEHRRWMLRLMQRQFGVKL